MKLTKNNKIAFSCFVNVLKAGKKLPISGSDLDRFTIKEKAIKLPWTETYGGLQFSRLWKLGILGCTNPNDNCKLYSLPTPLDISRAIINGLGDYPRKLFEILEETDNRR
jgi:hypothetical protein